MARFIEIDGEPQLEFTHEARASDRELDLIERHEPALRFPGAVYASGPFSVLGWESWRRLEQKDIYLRQLVRLTGRGAITTLTFPG